MPNPQEPPINPSRRSGCPLNIALEIFGDRWSLLIMRDLIFKGLSTFKDFQQSREGVASNILTSRLRKLAEEGLIKAERSGTDRRVVHYSPTRKGLDLTPVMIAMMTWTEKYEAHIAPRKTKQRMNHDSDAMIAEIIGQFEDE